LKIKEKKKNELKRNNSSNLLTIEARMLLPVKTPMKEPKVKV